MLPGDIETFQPAPSELRLQGRLLGIVLRTAELLTERVPCRYVSRVSLFTIYRPIRFRHIGASAFSALTGQLNFGI
jgi:hypothetical protein